MMMETDPSVAVSVRKLVMVSLMEIFKDIAPSYRIRPLTTDEKAVKVADTPPREIPTSCQSFLSLNVFVLQVKKETQLLREFEEGLVSQYKFFLEDLEQVIKGDHHTSTRHKPSDRRAHPPPVCPQTGSRRRGSAARRWACTRTAAWRRWPCAACASCWSLYRTSTSTTTSSSSSCRS